MIIHCHRCCSIFMGVSCSNQRRLTPILGSRSLEFEWGPFVLCLEASPTVHRGSLRVVLRVHFLLTLHLNFAPSRASSALLLTISSNHTRVCVQYASFISTLALCQHGFSNIIFA